MRPRPATGAERVALNKRSSDPFDDHIWEDDQYAVAVRSTMFDPNGPVWTHLFIYRHDGKPVDSWDDLQRIKNELCGRESEAVELYPAETRKLDRASIRHLWVIPEHERFWLGMEGDRDSIDLGPDRRWTFTPALEGE